MRPSHAESAGPRMYQEPNPCRLVSVTIEEHMSAQTCIDCHQLKTWLMMALSYWGTEFKLHGVSGTKNKATVIGGRVVVFYTTAWTGPAGHEKSRDWETKLYYASSDTGASA